MTIDFQGESVPAGTREALTGATLGEGEEVSACVSCGACYTLDSIAQLADSSCVACGGDAFVSRMVGPIAVPVPEILTPGDIGRRAITDALDRPHLPGVLWALGLGTGLDAADPIMRTLRPDAHRPGHDPAEPCPILVSAVPPSAPEGQNPTMARSAIPFTPSPEEVAWDDLQASRTSGSIEGRAKAWMAWRALRTKPINRREIREMRSAIAAWGYRLMYSTIGSGDAEPK